MATAKFPESALTGVVTGAFGAHAIKGRYPEERVRAFQTASQYAVGLLQSIEDDKKDLTQRMLASS